MVAVSPSASPLASPGSPSSSRIGLCPGFSQTVPSSDPLRRAGGQRPPRFQPPSECGHRRRVLALGLATVDIPLSGIGLLADRVQRCDGPVLNGLPRTAPVQHWVTDSELVQCLCASARGVAMLPRDPNADGRLQDLDRAGHPPPATRIQPALERPETLEWRVVPIDAVLQDVAERAETGLELLRGRAGLRQPVRGDVKDRGTSPLSIIEIPHLARHPDGGLTTAWSLASPPRR